MKNTPQRMVVEKTVKEMHDHPTAEDIYSRVVQILPTVSNATVYRILNALAAEGLICKVRLHEGADRFDYRVEPHSHIRCTQCGRVDDVDTLFTPDKDWISDPKGYSVTGCMMSFEGICKKCRNNG